MVYIGVLIVLSSRLVDLSFRGCVLICFMVCSYVCYFCWLLLVVVVVLWFGVY